MTGSYHTLLGQYVETFSRSRRLGDAMERYMRWLYGACSTILVPTRPIADYLTRMGYPADRIRIWARGVDVDTFTPERRSPRLRRQWHVDDRRPVVMYAGRLSREKGLDLLPDIQRRLYVDRVAHRLVFVGDGPMAGELRERCPDAHFTGRVPHDFVATAMASADVFLFPSATDTLGNVVLEAQASGLPVVVSNAGGPREMMLDGRTGLVAPAGDARVFGDHAIRLLRYVSERRSMGQRARAHAMGFTWPESLVPLVRCWETAAGRTAPEIATAADTIVPLQRPA
jgi:glycosyltransferase involved in cell wall biosynthesis